ncbi:MAG: hypothetical protein KatS3mg023_2737 [Armatimonadota bacterium]|nr:MAG: hypothetical protein KatS3mg023_2737 [Armatimonadota bacterium]
MPAQTAEEIYRRFIQGLPMSERLRLATMILQDVPEQAVVDYSEEWTEEDLRDFSASSRRYILRYPWTRAGKRIYQKEL